MPAGVFEGGATQRDLGDRQAREELLAELGKPGGAELAVHAYLETVGSDQGKPLLRERGGQHRVEGDGDRVCVLHVTVGVLSLFADWVHVVAAVVADAVPGLADAADVDEILLGYTREDHVEDFIDL